ncbi:MAG: arylesterase, partial [Rhodobacterales bacterium]
PHLAVAHNTLLSTDFLAALSELSAEDPALALPYLQPDGLHPNAAGVALIVNRLGPQVQALIAQSK